MSNLDINLQLDWPGSNVYLWVGTSNLPCIFFSGSEKGELQTHPVRLKGRKCLAQASWTTDKTCFEGSTVQDCYMGC